MKHRQTKRKAPPIFITIIFALFGSIFFLERAHAGTAAPTEVWVDARYCDTCPNDGRAWGQEAFATIQTSLDLLPTGGTVHVRPGTYHGPFTLSAPNLDLIGEDPATTILRLPSASGYLNQNVVTMAGKNGRLSGFTIVGGHDPKGDAVLVKNSATIEGNILWDSNAAISLAAQPADKVMIRANQLTGNISAISLESGNPQVVRNTISDNTIGINANNTSGATIIGNLIVRNGKGISLSSSGAQIVNNTIAYNTEVGITASYQNNLNPTVVKNSLLWGNGKDFNASSSGIFPVSYSNIEDGAAGTGNISSDPKLGSDWRLQPGSPCIDAGFTSAVPADLTRDLDGDSRVVAGTSGKSAVVDMGADEFNPARPLFDVFGLNARDEQEATGIEDGLNVILRSTVVAPAPTQYNSTGTWNYTIAAGGTVSGSPGCLPYNSVTGTSHLTQFGTEFTLITGGETFNGLVYQNRYEGATTISVGGGTLTEKLSFSLGSATAATGTLTWSFVVPNGACTGVSTLTVVKDPQSGPAPEKLMAVEMRTNGELTETGIYELTPGENRLWGMKMAIDGQTYLLRFTAPLVSGWYPMAIGDYRESSAKIAGIPDATITLKVTVEGWERIDLGFGSLDAYRLNSDIAASGVQSMTKVLKDWVVPYLGEIKTTGVTESFTLTAFTLADGAITAFTDHDGDGLKDYEEVVKHRTSWQQADTDSDGLTDKEEIDRGLSPLIADSDNDGIKDGLDNCPFVANTNQLDSDGDGLGNACDPDDDNDGVTDSQDRFPTNPGEWADNDHDGLGDNADTDDDNDGLSDGYEVAAGLNPRIADAGGDPDRDGVETLTEFLQDTAPLTWNPTISGQVTQSGAPLASLTIDALALDGDQHFSGESDANGRYIIPAVKGRYRVVAWSQKGYETVFFDNTGRWDRAAVIDLNATAVGNIDLCLTRGATLTGTIAGLDPGAEASIEAWSGAGQSWAVTVIHGTGGILPFTLTGMTPGLEYEITVHADGYIDGCLQADGTLGPITRAAPFRPGNALPAIVLTKGRTITGNIAGLTTAEKTMVTAQSDKGWGSAEVTADSAPTTFTIDGLPTGSGYRIAIWPESHLGGYWDGDGTPGSYRDALAIDLTNGNDNTIAFILAPGWTLTGSVRGLADGAAARVWAEEISTETTALVTIIGTGSGSDTFAIAGLADNGTYRLCVEAADYRGGCLGRDGLTIPEEANGITTAAPGSHVLTIGRGERISGVITGLADGEPATISAWSESSRSWDATTVFGLADEAVPYTLAGLAAADDFTVFFEPRDHAAKTYCELSSKNSPTNIHFHAFDGREIQGTVTGTSFAGVQVFAFCPAGGEQRTTELILNGDGIGTYHLPGLPAEKCLAGAAMTGRVLYHSATAKYTDAAAAPLNLGTGDLTVDFNFTGQTHYHLQGTVVGITRQEVVQIDAWDEASSCWGGTSRQGEGGFEIEVPPGNYKIAAYAAGRMDLYWAGKIGDAAVLTPVLAEATAVAAGTAPELGTFTLARGAAIKGTIMIQEEGGNKPAAHVHVEARRADGLINKGDYTDGEGRFTLTGLADGTYTLAIWALGAANAGKIVLSGADATIAITIAAAERAILSGKITKGGGPAAGAMIQLFQDGIFVNAVLADDTGSFRFEQTGVSGTYCLKADIEADGTIDYNTGCDQTITLTAGETMRDIVL